MDDAQASENYELKIEVRQPFTTPVIGYEIEPFHSFVVKDAATGSEVERTIKYSWYRERIFCCVHSSILATHQCLDCVALELPIKDSYHCHKQCFFDNWIRHRDQHFEKSEFIRNSTDGNYHVPAPLGRDENCIDIGNGELIDENAEVVNKDGIEWLKVGSSKTYLPRIADLDSILRLEYVAIDDSTGRHLSPVNVILTDPVKHSSSPDPRLMIKIETLQQLSSHDVTFTVLSYNILADMYSLNEVNCPKWARTWVFRRKNLLREITGYQAVIICLQEVQSDHFESFFKPELSRYGYSGMYKKKKTGLYIADKGCIPDGCATFYRQNLFKEVKTYEIEFARATKLVADALEPEKRKDGQIRLMKDNVALVVILEIVNDGRIHHPFKSRICVANTHIHANPSNPDTKFIQVSQLVKGLEKIAESKIPMLICGDFNSLPESDPYKFIVNGKIVTMPEKESDPLGVYRLVKLQHSLPLASAYSVILKAELEKNNRSRNINPDTHEPVFTNHGRLFSGTLDYIFFTEDSLEVESVLELVDKDKERIGGDSLPSPLWPSDHIAIMARFRMRHMPLSSLVSWPPLPSDPWRQEQQQQQQPQPGRRPF